MALNKKGVYFTLISIILVFVFLFLLSLPSTNKSIAKASSVEQRVISMNDFLLNLQRDVNRALYISSFRAVLAMEQSVINTGEFLNSTEQSFFEAITNGTINDKYYPIMQSSTFPDWIEKIRDEGNKINIITNISILSLSISQSSPWAIDVFSDIEIQIRDSNNLASWNINKTVKSSIPIIDFEDPMYVVNSFGRLTNIITTSPYINNYTYNNESNNFMEHIYNGYYMGDNNAPSFLQRFENNLTPNENGIESIIDLQELFQRSLPVFEDKSIIDYQYWNGGGENLYKITDTPSWVLIPQSHLSKYQLDDLAYLP